MPDEALGNTPGHVRTFLPLNHLLLYLTKQKRMHKTQKTKSPSWSILQSFKKKYFGGCPRPGTTNAAACDGTNMSMRWHNDPRQCTTTWQHAHTNSTITNKVQYVHAHHDYNYAPTATTPAELKFTNVPTYSLIHVLTYECTHANVLTY